MPKIFRYLIFACALLLPGAFALVVVKVGKIWMRRKGTMR